MTDMTLGRWSHVPAYPCQFLHNLSENGYRLSLEPACRFFHAHFNLVIRLSNVQQLAFFHLFTLSVDDVLQQLAAVLGFTSFSVVDWSLG